MSPDLDAQLCKDFPLLYRDRHKSSRSTCMCWGFACEDGWHDIIRELSEKLEAEIAKMPDDENRPCAMQVKEKFGTLRFYMSSESENMTRWIQEAENKSAKTCEACGKPGTVGGRSWLRTLCEACK